MCIIIIIKKTWQNFRSHNHKENEIVPQVINVTFREKKSIEAESQFSPSNCIQLCIHVKKKQKKNEVEYMRSWFEDLDWFEDLVDFVLGLLFMLNF